MQEEAQSVGAAIGTAISSLEEGDILFPINGLSMLGIGIGLLTIIPIYFFCLFKQVVIYINIKWLFGIFAFAEDDFIRIVCCDNINFCIFSVTPFADFCGSDTEK